MVLAMFAILLPQDQHQWRQVVVTAALVSAVCFMSSCLNPVELPERDQAPAGVSSKPLQQQSEQVSYELRHEFTCSSLNHPVRFDRVLPNDNPQDQWTSPCGRWRITVDAQSIGLFFRCWDDSTGTLASHSLIKENVEAFVASDDARILLCRIQSELGPSLIAYDLQRNWWPLWRSCYDRVALSPDGRIIAVQIKYAEPVPTGQPANPVRDVVQGYLVEEQQPGEPRSMLWHVEGRLLGGFHGQSLLIQRNDSAAIDCYRVVKRSEKSPAAGN